jgi:hypothetical protein
MRPTGPAPTAKTSVSPCFFLNPFISSPFVDPFSLSLPPLRGRCRRKVRSQVEVVVDWDLIGRQLASYLPQSLIHGALAKAAR